jgi:hypothetical protein
MSKNDQNIVNKINLHHKKITPLMIDINNKFKNKTNLNTDKYYRYLKKPDKITENGYITIIFGNSKYLPGILVSGYFIKYICKSKFNTICLVQDNPYYENGILRFEGLTSDEIEDIKKIYDVVIGIDVLHNKYLSNNNHHSKNMTYLPTKALVLGITLYQKLLYYDSSTIILRNIDYYFTKYNKSTYRNFFSINGSNRGLTANIFIFKPKNFYIDKALYLLDNYNTYFGKSFFTNDESIIYYTIFPNWNNNQLDQSKFIESIYNDLNKNIDKNSNINYYKNNNYEVSLNMAFKPFLYPYFKQIYFNNRDKFSLDFTLYNIWDNAAKKMLKKFKELTKYFEHIKTYRYTKL